MKYIDQLVLSKILLGQKYYADNFLDKIARLDQVLIPLGPTLEHSKPREETIIYSIS